MVDDRTSMIALENKVVYKHKYVHIFKGKSKVLPKKVQYFRDKFATVISKGMPSFWDNRGNFLPHEDYQALVVHNKGE